MWPAIGAIGGALAGGLFGKSSNDQNAEMQREFAQHGISWKVEDAKRAGLHPLYALGGSGATFTPSVQPIMTASEGANIGQNIARAATQDSGHERAVQLAQLKQLEASAEKDFALASAARSEAAVRQQQYLQSVPALRQPVVQSFPIPDPQVLEVGTTVDGVNVAMMDPSNIVNTPSYIAGEAKPALRPWKVAGIPGGEVLLPDAQNFAEALESLENPINQGFILHQNASHYGPRASAWLKDQLLRALREPWTRGAGSRIHRWSIK